MTLQQLLIEGRERLRQAGIAEAELDAKYLLMEAFELSASDLLLKRNEKVELGIDVYQEMIEKRCQRIPLQYILGTWEFMGLEFYVDERVLIPRQDTENLVELVLKEHQENDISILDMCTGSGCIAVSLAKLGNYRQVTAVDVSAGALEVAAENVNHLGVEKQVTCVLSNLYENIQPDAQYDIIVSNPPYIPTEVIEGLQPEVKEFEPRLALDGTADGLHFYRRLAQESGRFLHPGGWVYVEIGYDQGEAVSELFAKAGYVEIEVIKDTPGLDRIAKARYKGGAYV